MIKKKHIQTTLLIFGITSGVLAIWLIVLLVRQYGPQKPHQSVETETLARFHPPTSLPPTPTPEPQPEAMITIRPLATPTVTPTNTPEWMTYDGIDLKEMEVEALFTMACNSDTVYLPPFMVVPYRPEVLESGLFYYSPNFVIAWEHLGYHGLWIHSGRSLTSDELAAYPLQAYLEIDEIGFRRSPADFDTQLQACLIGSEMRLHQGDTLSINKVIAAVRIPPREVEEVSEHVMDLVPYLAEKYPKSGFDQMNSPGLIFNFCGRQLLSEAKNPDLGYWTQSRIIFGAVPVDFDL